MRLPEERPSTIREQEIETALVNLGYSAEDIQFRGDSRYLRIGYWKQLTPEAFAAIEKHITYTQCIEDSCCVDGYFYFLH